ncbi:MULTISPECIES: zinc ribbon domain-containing protein [unclassified Rhodococcus (in: high G+C Gram-positive bacteria)]|uniref:zinc ribbon domain-containing protein n=1 Tax=unclassified Rhodococcus (in: high G+C Gram-positive bacteria) TaxID=192944 RepID=UPI00233F282C|nr:MULTISPECIES: zinc ribbon domain-containing protein [unclassified Rhodococcus (in: high G+C Gram-positive bacteria)]MDC3725427.1 transposase [Rhodococcus sp. Rp3]WSE23669.1 zinc ribbon domain-containing protein [Rhodococcus sp. PD04]
MTDTTDHRRFAFTTRPYLAVDDTTGDPIGLDDLDTRIRWLLGLITGAETELLTRLWHPATFDTLTAGRDRDGRALPKHGHVVAARLGWAPTYPDGVYVPSRVSRVVTAQATATLRTSAYRDTAIASLSARFDPATGRIAPPAGGEVPVPSGFARGVRRQLLARTRRADASGASTSDAATTDDRTSDAATSASAQPERLRITDIQTPPQVSAMARLSAADKQLAELTVTDDAMILTVKLPTTGTPTTRTQWRAVRLTAALPPHLHGRPITAWHLPTLTLDGRGLLLRCAATEAVPAGEPRAATVAVGVDWSPSALGAAAIATDTGDGLVSDYEGYTYDDRGLGIKLARLQTEGQFLHRKAARLTRLAENAPPRLRAELEAKIAVLDENRTAVGAKRRKINREMAFHFARQVTDYAVAADATMIAVEDLATLEPRGRGRVNNNRAAQSARRKAADALAQTAARVGVVAVSVPARGSSAWCPGCNSPLARPGGYHNAWCAHCEVGGNRDHVAGVNLAKRVLLGRGAAVRTRAGNLEIRTIEHAPVRKCRDKTGPTPGRPRHRRVRRSVPAPTPAEGVNTLKSRPAPEASVWDTVEPAASQDVSGSREERGSGPPGM